MQPKSSVNKVVRLAIGAALAIGCWTVVLPALSDLPTVRRQLDRRNEQGINAGAMFYSELNAMPRVMERMDHVHANHGDAFWQRSAAEGP